MKILLIEDDDSQRVLLRHVVGKKVNAEIFEAKNGIEGLRLIDIHSPDLIILDIWMPIMNGLEMLDKLRQDEVHKAIPVLIITALKDKETIQSAVAKGVSGYILKPFSPEQVYTVLSKFIPIAAE
jgi:CheY-like chemotaxis protein